MALSRRQKEAASKEALGKIQKAEALAESDEYEGIIGELRAFLGMMKAVVAGDFGVPWMTLGIGALIVGYMLSPIDFIPDFIPALGFIDDVIVVSTLLVLINPDVEKFKASQKKKRRGRKGKVPSGKVARRVPAPMRKALQPLVSKAEEASRRGDFDGFGGNFKALIAMVSEFLKGNYDRVPIATLILSVLGIAYALSPIDFIPDVIPIVGLADDVAVGSTVAFLLLTVNPDLDDFKRWYAKGGRVPKGKSKKRGGKLPMRSPTIYAATGKDTTVLIPARAGADPIGIDARYALVELDQIQTSHLPMASFKPNPAYPKGVQEAKRNYQSIPGERNKVASMTRAMPISDAFFVTKNAKGQPIIDAAGIALSGNGRASAIERMYKHPAYRGQTGMYKKGLVSNARKFGLNPAMVEKMNRPVLVRMTRTPMPRGHYAAVVKEFNRRAPERFACPKHRTAFFLDKIFSQMPKGQTLTTWVHNERSVFTVLRDSGILKGQLLISGNMVTPMGLAHVERLALCGVLSPATVAALAPVEREALASAIPAIKALEARGGSIDFASGLNKAWKLEERLPEASTPEQTIKDIQMFVARSAYPVSTGCAFLVVYLRHFASVNTRGHLESLGRRKAGTPAQRLAAAVGPKGQRALKGVRSIRGIGKNESLGG